jgi:hypothetical protein
MSSTTYDPQNAVSSRLSLVACSSLASNFTRMISSPPLDVVEASGASAATDPFFAYHDAQPECSGPSTRSLPADHCSASSPPLYIDGLEWRSHLLLEAEAEVHNLQYPRDVPFTFEHSHSGTALGLYIPQTDEPSGSRPWGPSVDTNVNCKPEPEQTRASGAMSARASYHSSSQAHHGQSEWGDQQHYADPCSPILCCLPRLLDTIVFATSSSVPTASR